MYTQYNVIIYIYTHSNIYIYMDAVRAYIYIHILYSDSVIYIYIDLSLIAELCTFQFRHVLWQT